MATAVAPAPDRPCTGCRARPGRVQPYWSPAELLCGACCTGEAAGHDAHDDWPPVVWRNGEPTTEATP